jgi:hypothetical protein
MAMGLKFYQVAWRSCVPPDLSRLPLDREYRVTPLGDAATVAAHEKIDAALRRPLEEQVTFAETPLRDVVKTFRDRLGVPVVVDRKAFEDAGLDLDTTVITFTSHGITARARTGRATDSSRGGRAGLGWLARWCEWLPAGRSGRRLLMPAI